MQSGMIKSTHHCGRNTKISTVLSDLAAQEGCDGEPWDVMQQAAEYIIELEEHVIILENKLQDIENACKFVNSLYGGE